MGHLDGRLAADTAPSAKPEGDAKDGPTGQKTDMAPNKDDARERSLDKASDVIHPGGGQGPSHSKDL